MYHYQRLCQETSVAFVGELAAGHSTNHFLWYLPREVERKKKTTLFFPRVIDHKEMLERERNFSKYRNNPFLISDYIRDNNCFRYYYVVSVNMYNTWIFPVIIKY